jgi:hypothetical protein
MVRKIKRRNIILQKAEIFTRLAAEIFLVERRRILSASGGIFLRRKTKSIIPPLVEILKMLRFC